MRQLPPEIAAQMSPLPGDFRPEFEDHKRYVRWSAVLDLPNTSKINVELGFTRKGGQADEAAMREQLRASAWQTTELARLGRDDLLAYCKVGRFRR